MIAYLIGQVKQINDKSIVLLVNGVGYDVFCSGKLLSEVKKGQDLELEIFTVVKEDAFHLYGFSSQQDKKMFELLLGISGVGPKSALNILDAASVQEITEAVINQDPAILKTVSGIGPKTAERIVLELKNKITKGQALSAASGRGQIDVVEALQGLGYQLMEIREALQSVDNNLSLEDKIKAALKNLGR